VSANLNLRRQKFLPAFGHGENTNTDQSNGPGKRKGLKLTTNLSRIKKEKIHSKLALKFAQI
jgi:hypothetical protein